MLDALDEAKEAWASEAFVGSSIQETAIQNAAALGGIRVLKDLIAKIKDMQEMEI